MGTVFCRDKTAPENGYDETRLKKKQRTAMAK
jgi:hypothetical protein